jgi:hypothetical protein
LRVNDDGAAVLPVWLAWNPMVAEAPGAVVPLYDRLVALTAPLPGVYVAFHPEVVVCPLGRVKARRHPLMVALPVFAMVMLLVSPVFQALITSDTAQLAFSGAEVGGGLDPAGSIQICRVVGRRLPVEATFQLSC